jgi:hypothetical protein
MDSIGELLLIPFPIPTPSLLAIDGIDWAPPPSAAAKAPLLFSSGLPAQAEPTHVLGQARNWVDLSPRCTVHFHLFQ